MGNQTVLKLFVAATQYGDDDSGELVVMVLGDSGDKVHTAGFAAHDRGETSDPIFLRLTAEQATQPGMKRGAIVRRSDLKVLGYASRRGEVRFPVAVHADATYVIETRPGEFVAYERAPAASGRADIALVSRKSRKEAAEAAVLYLAARGSCFAAEMSVVGKAVRS